MEEILPPEASMLDFADWRIIIHIASDRLRAYLKHVSDERLPIRTLTDTEWDASDSKTLLKGLEAAVYNCPALLEDYEADVIISTPLYMFAPAEAIEYPGDAETIYSTVYQAGETDIFQDINGDLRCLHCAAAGLRPFIERTFPGARVSAGVSVILRHFLNSTSSERSIVLNMRNRDVDVMALGKGNLLSCATYQYDAMSDILYYAVRTANAIGFDTEKDQYIVVAPADLRKLLLDELRSMGYEACGANIPRYADNPDIPAEAAIMLSYRNPQI